MSSYLERLKAADPTAYAKLEQLMSYSANENYGGKPQDWQAEIFAGIDPKAIGAPSSIDFDAATRADPDNRIIGNNEDNWAQVVGYRKPVTTASGTKIFAEYDANGNLTGYSGNPMQRSFLNGSQSVSGRWDASGKATPQQYSSSSGSFLGGLAGGLGDIATDIAPMALKAAALYYGGQALGGALGGETAAAGLGDLGATDMSLGAAGEANAAANAAGAGELTAQQVSDMSLGAAGEANAAANAAGAGELTAQQVSDMSLGAAGEANAAANAAGAGELTAQQVSDMIAADQASSMSAQEALDKIAQEQAASAASGSASTAAAGKTGWDMASTLGLGALGAAAAGSLLIPDIPSAPGSAYKASESKPDWSMKFDDPVKQMDVPDSFDFQLDSVASPYLTMSQTGPIMGDMLFDPTQQYNSGLVRGLRSMSNAPSSQNPAFTLYQSAKP